MKRYNVAVKKVFQSQGKERHQWNQIGTLTQFPADKDKDESFILELHMFPETKFYLFEQKPDKPET